MKLALLPPESWVPKKAQWTTGSGWGGPASFSATRTPRLHQNQDMLQGCRLLAVSGHCASLRREARWVEQEKQLVDLQVTQPFLSLKRKQPLRGIPSEVTLAITVALEPLRSVQPHKVEMILPWR